MKNLICISIILLFNLTSQAQHDWDSENWDRESLGFGCSIDASMTKPVWKVIPLFIEKDFEEIRKMLYSNLPANQFLAVFLLEKLSKKKELELNSLELKKMEQIKSSTEIVPVCSGCTYWAEEPLSKLFSSERKHIIYQSAENWFKAYYKIYYKKR